MKWRICIAIFILLCIVTGPVERPRFAVASGACYVDEDADDDGDGSDDEPYQDIEEALDDDDCMTITVSDGSYGDTLTIGDNVTVSGKNRDGVKITGGVTMEDGASLKNVTISSTSGVDVTKDAEVTIDNVKIVGANVGIETVAGRGKVTAKNVKITGGNKGMYLQAGNTVKITGCEIYDNDEEGIDIRANVDGTISGNTINGNGESGIEVILGKAELLISDNKLKNNGASGISLQYYKGSGKSGAVKLKGNTITGNSDFGVNCKTPSGGNPGKDFWGESLNMSSNKVSSNKDGDFAPDCSFSETAISDATTTQKQRDEAAEKARIEAEQKAQRVQDALNVQQQKQTDAEEQKKREEIEAQDRERIQLQRNTESIAIVQGVVSELESTFAQDKASADRASGRNAFVMFLIGPKRKEVDAITQNLGQYTEKINTAKASLENIMDSNQRSTLQSQVDTFQQKHDDLVSFVEQQNSEFSLFGWIF